MSSREVSVSRQIAQQAPRTFICSIAKSRMGIGSQGMPCHQAHWTCFLA